MSCQQGQTTSLMLYPLSRKIYGQDSREDTHALLSLLGHICVIHSNAEVGYVQIYALLQALVGLCAATPLSPALTRKSCQCFDSMASINVVNAESTALDISYAADDWRQSAQTAALQQPASTKRFTEQVWQRSDHMSAGYLDVLAHASKHWHRKH